MEISIDDLVSENWENIFRDAREQTIHVRIDNVERYMKRLLDKGESVGIEKYAPVLAPSFESVNFVYYVPEYGYHQSVLVSAFDAEPQDLEYENDPCRGIIHFDVKAPSPYDESALISSLRIDAVGTVINKNQECYPSEKFKGMDDDVIGAVYRTMTMPVLMAMSFMHCKNVHLIDEPLTRQRRRKLERKGGIRYKVLDIEPFKKQVRRETQPGESQLQRALHICRGHFATYTEDKPLFGKLVGTYWKPMHVRGNKAHGQIVKDYNIKLD